MICTCPLCHPPPPARTISQHVKIVPRVPLAHQDSAAPLLPQNAHLRRVGHFHLLDLLLISNTFGPPACPGHLPCRPPVRLLVRSSANFSRFSGYIILISYVLRRQEKEGSMAVEQWDSSSFVSMKLLLPIQSIWGRIL